MPMKLVDVQCVNCSNIVRDVLVKESSFNDDGLHEDEDGEISCGCEFKGPYKVVLSVPRHSKHSSWEVR
jgi:hypothetical protein